MTDVIRIDYEALQKIAEQFGQQADSVAQMVQAVRGALDPLEGGGWVGRGSDAFFTEMDSDILPAVQRLIDALGQARDVSKQIGSLMQEADEEASTGFKGDAGVGTGGAFAGGIGAAIGQTLQTGGASGGAGGSWGNGLFNPGGSLANLMAGKGFGGLGAAGLGNALGGGLGGGLGSNDYGIPSNWLSGVGDSLSGFMGSNFNDYGIPRDWLSGVTGASGGSSYNDYGIPQDWLSDVTDAFGGESAASAGAASGGAGAAGGGSGSEAAPSASGGGSGSSPSTGGGGSGGGSPQSDISDPYSRGSATRGFQATGASGGSLATASQAGGLRYQSLGGMASGGGAGATAVSGGAAAGLSGGGGAAPAAAAGGQSNSGIAFGIAAASPFLALLGKAIKGQMDDD